MSLEENRVLEALVACEPEALVSLEDAALPARLFPQNVQPSPNLMFSALSKYETFKPF